MGYTMAMGYNGRTLADRAVVASLMGDRCEIAQDNTLAICADKVLVNGQDLFICSVRAVSWRHPIRPKQSANWTSHSADCLKLLPHNRRCSRPTESESTKLLLEWRCAKLQVRSSKLR